MHMPRITVYVPDDLKARMDGAGDNLNWSAITQHAIRKAIATQTLSRNPTDMTNVLERLRASKQRGEEGSAASGRRCGAEWARRFAEYKELRRVWIAVRDGIDINLDRLQRLIDLDQEMDHHDWQSLRERCGEDRPDDAFAAGFAGAAHDVFEEVKDQL